MSKRSTPFLFFCHFIQRHNITMNREFDSFEASFMNMKMSTSYVPDAAYLPYFNIFENHLHRVGMFWYMALLYLCPLDILRRYFTFLQVETWKVSSDESFVPESYDKLQVKSKDDILSDLQKYVADNNLRFLMMIQAMANFF